MNGWFVAALVMLAVSGVLFGVRSMAPNSDSEVRQAGSMLGGIFLGLGVLLVLIASMNMVGTKKIGVITSFGKPVGTLSNGLHFTAPWQKVSEMDGAIQTDTHAGSGNIEVKLATQSTAYVDGSIRWRIKPDSADALFRDYQDLDRVRDSLVTKQLQATLGDVFVTINPLANLASSGAATFDMEKLSTAVAEKLRTRVGDQVEILSVILRPVRFDKATEESINAFQRAQADTRIAEQKKATATADAAANKILSDSVNNSANVLVSKCLDMVKAGATLPPNFQCWPGTGAGAIAIPSK